MRGHTTAWATSGIERIVRWWWIQVPVRTARYFPTFGSGLSDGLYLARWPIVAASATPAALLIGVLLGAYHPGATFSHSAWVMALAISAGLISAQLGVGVVVGYAVGDLFYHDHASFQRNAVQVLLRVHLPLLLSYVLLALAAVTLPLIGASARLQVRSARLYQSFPQVGRVAEAVVYAALMGALVYAWTSAVAVLIRPVFTWQGGQPPVEAIRPLQTQGRLLAGAAAAVAIARVLLEEAASHPRVIALAVPLSLALHRAIRHRHRAAGVLGLLAGALGLTLVMAGIISGPVEGALVFGFLAVLLWTRDRVRAASWLPLRLMGRVPELLRLAAGFALGYYVSARVVAPLWNTTQTFRPVLLAACCSLAIMTLLMAPSAARPADVPSGAGAGGG